MKLKIGVTDVEHEYIHVNEESETFEYNVRQPLPELAQAEFTWNLNTDLPAVQNMYKSFQRLKERPHLNLFNVDQQPYKLSPDVINTVLSVQFMSLLPKSFGNDEAELYSVYEQQDYESFQTQTEFGDLVFDVPKQLAMNGLAWSNSLFSAARSKKLDNLADGPYDLYALPAFNCRFETSKQMATVHTLYGRTELQTLWMERNQEVLESKGYMIDDYRTNTGWLVAGKLETDHYQAYEDMLKYKYVTHYEFIE